MIEADSLIWSTYAIVFSRNTRYFGLPFSGMEQRVESRLFKGEKDNEKMREDNTGKREQLIKD